MTQRPITQVGLKHAIVTGGGSGIGAVIADQLLKNGAKVSIMGRRLDALDECRKQLGNLSNSQAIRCDVSEASEVSQAFQTACASFGPASILVNCAGAAPTQAFHKLTAEDWRQVMAVNLDGVFNCSSAVIDDMRSAKAGRIINIASTAALKGYAYVSAYCAAKHGVVGLTKALALETAALGITVNAICPGYTDTDIIRNAVANIVEKTGRSEAEALATFTNVNPQQRLIEPSEVAATVLWLCADSSAGITGQSISVSAGEVM
ncbi:MAG: SDR family NAD(P)-dependent oxidoreductase [Pseudomonadales bacterium]